MNARLGRLPRLIKFPSVRLFVNSNPFWALFACTGPAVTNAVLWSSATLWEDPVSMPINKPAGNHCRGLSENAPIS